MDILYTDTDQIRGALFLSPEDIREETFNQALLERELRNDLDEWLPGHAGLVSNRATPADQRVSDLIATYSTYWCANKVAALAQVAIPQQVSDGKNMLKRGASFEDVLATVRGTMADAKAKLALIVSGSSVSSVSQASIVGAAIDPVTYSGT